MHEEPNMKIEWTTIVVAVITLIGSVTAAWITAQSKAESTTKEIISGFHSVKVCSVYQPELWRDNTLVPMSWKPETCKNFGQKVGAWQYQLGCMFEDTLTLGDPNSGKGPVPNCGW
jgi:hypothetical protein